MNDIHYEIETMKIIESIQQGKTVDFLLDNYSYIRVYDLVRTFVIEIPENIRSDIKKKSIIIYKEMIERFPIDKYPEKYI